MKFFYNEDNREALIFNFKSIGSYWNLIIIAIWRK
jgi:hypothetical protein